MSKEPQAIRIPVRLPRADWLACGKALRNGFSASMLEEVTLEFSGGQLTISTRWGGTVMPYEGNYEGAFILRGGAYQQLVSSNTKGHTSEPWIKGKVDLELKEFALGNAGVKCKFV